MAGLTGTGWLQRLPPNPPAAASSSKGRSRIRKRGGGDSDDDGRNPFAQYKHGGNGVEDIDSDEDLSMLLDKEVKVPAPPIARKQGAAAAGGGDGGGVQWIERVVPAAPDPSSRKTNRPVIPGTEAGSSRENLKARRAALTSKAPSSRSKRPPSRTSSNGIASAAAAGGGGGKKGRLRRKRDDDSSDDEDILASPKPVIKAEKKPASEDDIIILDDSPIVGGGGASSYSDKKKKEASSPTEKRSRVEEKKEEEGVIEIVDGTSPAKAVGMNGTAEKSDSATERKIVCLDEEEEDDSEEEEYDEEKETSDRIIRACEMISEKLMKELQHWGQSNAQDRIDLTSMDDEVQTFSSSSQGSKRIDLSVLKAAIPQVTLKPYQLVGLNWLYLLHQLELDLPSDLLPPEASKGRYGKDPLRINGILADEMGLGKTVQTIAFIAYLNQLERGQHTYLIVVPASVLSNWENEFERFAPHLMTWTYHGSAKERADLREEYEDKDEHCDVILATYTFWEKDSCEDDRRFLNKLSIQYMVLDEGHNVKNTTSQRFIRLRKQKVRRRLILSGTPLQNHVNEFLSLLSFLNPRIISLGDSPEAFYNTLASDIGERAAILKLKRLFAPFVLRRLKVDVLDQLTSKTTKLELMEMPESQRQVYESVTARHLEKMNANNEQKVLEELTLPVLSTDLDGPRTLRSDAAASASSSSSAADEKESSSSSIVIAPSSDKEAGNIFVEWRKAANHPLLLRRRYNDEQIEEIAKILHQTGFYGWECTQPMVHKEVSQLCDFELHTLVKHEKRLEHLALPPEAIYDSCKCKKLKELLPRLIQEGHRCLIFSTWTRILDILEGLIEYLDIPFLRLDGSTKIQERQELIDTFNAPDSPYPVFLLSTRAGGLGINLTSADTVILHDPDWNPSFDQQCMDRCHRIGQTKPVTVYQLVAKDTVDEKVYNRAKNKKEKSDALLDGVVEESTKENDSKEISKIVQEELAKWMLTRKGGQGGNGGGREGGGGGTTTVS